MSRMARSGRSAVTLLDGGLPVADLRYHRVALFLEHLLEVEADQRFILGDHDTQQVLAHAHERTVIR